MNGTLWNLPLLIGVPEGASASGGAGGQMVSLLVTFGLIILIFYFLIIRPQSKKQKETQRMLESLKRGDRVVTAGGIRGQIHSIKEDTVVLKVDDNTKLELNRSAISSVITGERKSGGKSRAAGSKGGKKKAALTEEASNGADEADAGDDSAEE